MSKARQIWDKTSGYKTKTGAVLLALYSLIQAVAPGLLTGQTDTIVRNSIDFLIITGGADWVYRNRHSIINFIKKLTTWKKEKGS
jgi:hypothetical protein